jgi:hypothetical protein
VALLRVSQKRKFWDLMGSLPISIRCLKKYYHSLNLQEGTLPNSFYKASIALIQNQTRDTTKKNYGSTILMNINAKSLNKIMAN